MKNSAFKIQESEFGKLQKQLDRFLDRVTTNVAKSAARKATTPVQKTMRALAPVESGTLKRAIKKSVRGYRGNAVVVGLVGVSFGVSGKFKGKTRIPAFYAHFVEFGLGRVVAKNGRRKHGKSVKATKPKPFIRPAFDQNKGLMEKIAREELKKGSEAAAKRLRNE